MDGAIAIILISVAMFAGCFLLGLIPLMVKLSEVSEFTAVLLNFSEEASGLSLKLLAKLQPDFAVCPAIFVHYLLTGSGEISTIYTF